MNSPVIKVFNCIKQIGMCDNVSQLMKPRLEIYYELHIATHFYICIQPNIFYSFIHNVNIMNYVLNPWPITSKKCSSSTPVLTMNRIVIFCMKIIRNYYSSYFPKISQLPFKNDNKYIGNTHNSRNCVLHRVIDLFTDSVLLNQIPFNNFVLFLVTIFKINSYILFANFNDSVHVNKFLKYDIGTFPICSKLHIPNKFAKFCVTRHCDDNENLNSCMVNLCNKLKSIVMFMYILVHEQYFVQSKDFTRYEVNT